MLNNEFKLVLIALLFLVFTPEMGDSHALRGVIVTISTSVSAEVDSRHISLLLIFLLEIKIAFSFQLPLEFTVQTNFSSLVVTTF